MTCPFYLGHRLHLSMDVDLYTFVDTCCLHYHQFWRIGLYIYIYPRDMKPSSKLEARRNTLPDSHLISFALGPAPLICDYYYIIINRTRNTKHPRISTLAKTPLYLDAPPIHIPNSIISQSVILTPYTAQPVSNYDATLR